MEILCSQLYKNIMLARGSKYLSTAAIAALGVGCWQERKWFTTQRNLYAKDGDEGESWYSKLIAQTSTERISMSDEHMTSKLKRQEYSHEIDQKNGSVTWFETNHYNANNPIEDRHCECLLDGDNSYFFGIFDGHSGWHCSESLRLRLPLYISLAMTCEDTRKKFISGDLLPSDLVKYLGNPNDDCLSFKMPPTFKEKQADIKSGPLPFTEKSTKLVPGLDIADILKYTYLSLDRDISRESIPDGKCNEAIWTGLSGAVAVSAFIKGTQLYVANTGMFNHVCLFTLFYFIT